MIALLTSFCSLRCLRIGPKLHFSNVLMPCFLLRICLKSAKKFLMNIGAVSGFPRCIPSGSIPANNVALYSVEIVVIEYHIYDNDCE